MNKNTLQGQIHHSLHPFLLIADTTARELWWTNQEFSSVNIIPP
jgi:hypothetical protein